jgi:hypothetical protein
MMTVERWTLRWGVVKHLTLAEVVIYSHEIEHGHWVQPPTIKMRSGRPSLVEPRTLGTIWKYVLVTLPLVIWTFSWVPICHALQWPRGLRNFRNNTGKGGPCSIQNGHFWHLFQEKVLLFMSGAGSKLRKYIWSRAYVPYKEYFPNAHKWRPVVQWHCPSYEVVWH